MKKTSEADEEGGGERTKKKGNQKWQISKEEEHICQLLIKQRTGWPLCIICQFLNILSIFIALAG